MNNWFLLKIIHTSRLKYKNHTLFMSKWPKSASIDTLFITKMAEKPYIWDIPIPGFHVTSEKTEIKNFSFSLYQVKAIFKDISVGLFSAR